MIACFQSAKRVGEESRESRRGKPVGALYAAHDAAKDERTALVPSFRARHVLLPEVFRFTQGTEKSVLEFFAARLRNRNTRKAYAQAVGSTPYHANPPPAPSTS